MKFNKTIKTQMINAAITNKFEKKYEDQVKNVELVARELLVENSLHESIVGKLSDEELKYCRATATVSFDCGIRLDYLPFTNQTCISQVSFSPVYGADHYYLEDKKCLELARLRCLVTTIKEELNELSTVVHSYSKAKHLFEALPWIKEFYPEQIVTSGTMVAKDVIDSINAKFG